MSPMPAPETAKVYCPMCTHTVEAEIQPPPIRGARRPAVSPGQKCPHCSAALDAGYIMSPISTRVRAA
jgi:hypothetical protein